jgi:hypothetical protein
MDLQTGVQQWEGSYSAVEKSDREMSVDQLLSRPDASSFPGLHEAVAYLFSRELNGLRHRGKARDIIASHRGSVIGVRSGRGGVVLLTNNQLNRAVIISRAGGAIGSKAAYVSGIRILASSVKRPEK